MTAFKIVSVNIATDNLVVFSNTNNIFKDYLILLISGTLNGKIGAADIEILDYSYTVLFHHKQNS